MVINASQYSALLLLDEFKQENEPPKKGIMTRPGAKRVAKAEVFEEEEFPDLGAEIDPTKIKKKPKPQPQDTESTSTTQTHSGPRKFLNSKKAAGETFAQLETPVEKKEEETEEVQKPSKTEEASGEKPKFQITRTEMTRADNQKTENPRTENPRTEISRADISRADNQKTESPSTENPKQETGGFAITRGPNRSELASKAEAKKDEQKAEDSKFKFGGEGPKRFVSSKKEAGPTIREEHKTEADVSSFHNINY